MRLARSLIPTLKENPVEAQIASHRLMLRAGLIRQNTAGIYTWLPVGLRVLENIQKIIDEEQQRVGVQKILMPTIQSAELWKESGRYGDYGKEMLRIKDRNERDLLYSPTNEEMITDIFRQCVSSYRQLPQNVYQIQWKFRDEIRPRFGVMRGREFLMKDGYSFDLTYKGAMAAYRRNMLSYMRIFERLGAKAIPMKADTGQIGGKLSHEFIILAPAGESNVFYDAAFEEQDFTCNGCNHEDYVGLEKFYQALCTPYAATEEMHNETMWKGIPVERRREGRGVEVGHIFYFGTKYSQSMGLAVTNAEGQKIFPEMGSYGIGISRLVSALIESSHDEAGIIWPASVAPFQAVILNLKQGDPVCDALSEKIYAAFEHKALYDDRNERAGVKFFDADLSGHPWQIIIGPRFAKEGRVELKKRCTGERFNLDTDVALNKITRQA